jgi:hypothetical protein
MEPGLPYVAAMAPGRRRSGGAWPAEQWRWHRSREGDGIVVKPVRFGSTLWFDGSEA